MGIGACPGTGSPAPGLGHLVLKSDSLLTQEYH